MGKFGGGQPFTQTEKDRLSILGNVASDTRTTSTTIPANTWTTVVGITGLNASAEYLFICKCTFSSQYTGGFSMRLYNGNGETTPLDDKYVTSGAWNFMYIAKHSGTSNYQFQVNTNGANRTGSTAAGASITAIRIK